MGGVVKTTWPIRGSRTSNMFMTALGIGDPYLYLFLYGRFIDQHHGDVVFDRIHAVAGVALQPGALVHQHDGSFAIGTRENFQQFGIERHIDSSLQRLSKTIAEPRAEP